MDKAMRIAVTLSAYDKMSTVVNSAVDKAQRKLKEFSTSVNSFGNKAMITGGIGAGIFAGAIKSAADMEKMQVSLKTSFQGNEEAAKKAFLTINKFAASTPYALEEVMTGFVKLKNIGLDPSEAALTAYGNTASSMGKDLNQMIEAVADAATGEFERLKEFGIKASSQGDKVSFLFQGVKTTVNKNSKEIEAYLQKIGNTKFAGGIEAQSKTINGQISTLKDNVTMASATVGATFIPMLNKLFIAVTPVINKIQKWVEEYPTLIKYIGLSTVALFGLGAASKVVAYAMGGVAPVIKATMFLMKLLQGDAIATAMAMKGLKVAMMSTGILLIVAAIAAAAYLIYNNWGPIKEWVTNLWTKITAAFSKAWQFIKNIFLNYTPQGLIIKHWSKISGFFVGLWSGIKTVFSATWQYITGLFTKYSPAAIIYNHWGELVGWFTNLWQRVTKIFSNAWAGIKGVFGFGDTKDVNTAANAYQKSLDAVNKKTQRSIGFDANSNVNINSAGGTPLAAGLKPNSVSNTSSINYSPVINFTGSQQDATALTGMMKNNFDKQLQEHQAQQKRRAF